MVHDGARNLGKPLAGVLPRDGLSSRRARALSKRPKPDVRGAPGPRVAGTVRSRTRSIHVTPSSRPSRHTCRMKEVFVHDAVPEMSHGDARTGRGYHEAALRLMGAHRTSPARATPRRSAPAPSWGCGWSSPPNPTRNAPLEGLIFEALSSGHLTNPNGQSSVHSVRTVRAVVPANRSRDPGPVHQPSPGPAPGWHRGTMAPQGAPVWRL